jgi:SRSO17 transposase
MQDEGYLELADLDASEYDSAQSGLWTRGLLIRRNLADGECAYFTTWCPAGTGIETLVAVEGQRWSIEDSFETSKNELGLDHNGRAARDRLTAPGTAGTVMSRW